MTTERLVKWSKEAKEFFEKAGDKSLVLDLVISYGCDSQTGEGFKELVNTINSEEIKRKVKKVNIIDTSYLYRHDIPEFIRYKDSNIPTIWLLKNKCTIEKLSVPVEVKSWSNEINTDAFAKWFKQIKKDFNTNLKFRDTVNIESATVCSSKNGNFETCRDFLLEEAIHACSSLKNRIAVYPMKLADSITCAMNIYDLKLTHLRYRVSDDARQNEYTPYILRKTAIDYDQIDLRVAAFMRNYIEGVNFFVINKEGEYIYKNNAFGKIVRNINAQTLDPKSWAVSKKVMEQGIQKTVEEEFQGTTYLSIKAPLVIDYMVEGVIGLAVDITDRKKKEELENKLKIGEELYRIAKTVTHDLAQPVTVLRGYLDINKSLSHKERRVYNKAIENIESIAERLFSKYRGTNKVVKNQYILLWLCLKEVIEEQRKIDSDIEIKYLFNSSEKFVFIKGNMVDFSRMISNIIKNSIEAVEGKKREIKVSYEVKGEAMFISRSAEMK